VIAVGEGDDDDVDGGTGTSINASEEDVRTDEKKRQWFYTKCYLSLPKPLR
jgi:hypothetical protein